VQLWMRRLHLVFAWLFVGAVVFQVFLAGLALFVSPRHWEDHFAFGVLGVTLAALLVLLSAIAARLPRSAVGFAALPILSWFGQEVLASLRFEESTKILAALHPVGALVMLWVGVIVARRARGFVTEAEFTQPSASLEPS
jgi:hypothetical protein